MNAQQLLNETPTTNFNFGAFWGKTRESLQSQIKRGDIQREEFSHTTYCSPSSDILKKININNCKNTQTFKADVIRSMGIEGL